MGFWSDTAHDRATASKRDKGRWHNPAESRSAFRERRKDEKAEKLIAEFREQQANKKWWQ